MPSDLQSIRIGGVDYPTPSHSVGTDVRRYLEVTGKNNSSHSDRMLMLIEQFGDTRIKDLPPDLDIHIDYPNTPLTVFENFELKNQYHKGIIRFTVFYSHSSWNKPKNLWHHIKELSGKMLSELEDITSVEVLQDEGCAWINGKADISSSSVVHEYIVTLEKRIAELSLQIEKQQPKVSTEPSQHQLKPDDKGLKWWIRYVIVPVIGSATLLAILKLAAGQA